MAPQLQQGAYCGFVRDTLIPSLLLSELHRQRQRVARRNVKSCTLLGQADTPSAQANIAVQLASSQARGLLLDGVVELIQPIELLAEM